MKTQNTTHFSLSKNDFYPQEREKQTFLQKISEKIRNFLDNAE